MQASEGLGLTHGHHPINAFINGQNNAPHRKKPDRLWNLYSL